MKITIVTAGKIKEKYLTAGINEFLKRLGPFATVKIVEINEEKMKDNPSEAEKQQTLQQEGQRLLRQVPEGSYLFVLDVYGQQLSSEKLAAKLDSLALQGRSNITFLRGCLWPIGGGKAGGRFPAEFFPYDLYPPDDKAFAGGADISLF